jgi:DNA primase
MNIAQAKKIQIIAYLKQQGISPIKNSGNEFHFLSPFRKETVASFHVNYQKNVWHDKGTGDGGNIVDLILELKKCSISQALSLLSNGNHIISSYPPALKSTISPQKKCILTKVIDLNHPALLDYLSKRKIDLEIAKNWVKEIHYTIGTTPLFAIGIKNNKDGYEARNPGFKGCIGKKGISCLHSKKNKTSDDIYIFEGLFDFLSYLSLKIDPNITTSRTIILHSTALVKETISLLHTTKFKTCKCFMDNDASGKHALKAIIKSFPNKVCNASNLYKNYKDINEYLLKKFN